MLNTSCPSCGSPISFANKGALATVCSACHTVSIRQGQDLTAYGTVGEIQEDASVIQVGTTGALDGSEFSVVGRLQVRFKDGFWNEWHIVFQDGTYGWLAEAQGQFSITRPIDAPAPQRAHDDYASRQKVMVHGQQFLVSGVGEAHVIAGEGTLPFPVDSTGYRLPFVDLTNQQGGCATLDYSDEPASERPKVFMGRWVEPLDLGLKGLRSQKQEAYRQAGDSNVTANALSCPNCGGGLQRVTGLQAASIHCQFCGSAIDTSQSPFTVYQAEASRKGKIGELLALGDTGSLNGHEYSVIAILEREATKWSFTFVEYLLYNPLMGYRWLVEADRHYTLMRSVPYELETDGSRAIDGDTEYNEIDSGPVVVRRVVGELYWRVKVGDRVKAIDYANAPYSASLELASDEYTWSTGEYIDGAAVATAFGKMAPPEPRTVAANQPNPYGKDLRAMGVRWLIGLIGIALVTLIISALADSAVIGEQSATIELPTAKVRKHLRTPKDADALAWRDKHTLFLGPLTVSDGPTTIELDFKGDKSGVLGYLSFTCSLYDPERAESRDFIAGDVKLHSKSADERRVRIVIPGVKKGSYYLRLEPYLSFLSYSDAIRNSVKTIRYNLTVRRDVPVYDPLWTVFFVISLPLVWVFWRRRRFEARRLEDN